MIFRLIGFALVGCVVMFLYNYYSPVSILTYVPVILLMGATIVGSYFLHYGSFKVSLKSEDEVIGLFATLKSGFVAGGTMSVLLNVFWAIEASVNEVTYKFDAFRMQSASAITAILITTFGVFVLDTQIQRFKTQKS